MKKLLLLVAAALVPAAALGQSDIFVCEDSDGRKTYQNTGTAKGCKRLDIQPLVSVPAPRLPAARPAEPARRVVPANFPRVDDATQRARDSDRRRILEDELKSEQDRLQRLRAEFNEGEPERRGDERNFARYQERVARLREEIERAESNVASLQRELALTRQ
jgi:hypothetical protein